MKHFLISICLATRLYSAEEPEAPACSTWKPLEEYELRAKDYIEENTLKSTTVTYTIDEYACSEHTFWNEDKTVRGRLITYYKNGRRHKSVAFKGYSTPWFSKAFQHKTDNGRDYYLMEVFDSSGKTIYKETEHKLGFLGLNT